MLTESLLFIKNLILEDNYHTQHEKEFLEKYFCTTGMPKFSIYRELLTTQEKFVLNYPYMPNPSIGIFYDSLYSSLKIIYEIDLVLDQIIYNGITLSRSIELMDLCCFLAPLTTNVMISLDDDFSFQKKYSLANDIYVMAINLYNLQLLIHTSSKEELSRDDNVLITEFDELDTRLSCKYIQNGIALIKLFNILSILQTSPFYTEGVNKTAKKLIQSLREVLYDKRIIKLVVDVDIQGKNNKAHKTTRIKIYFSMGNSDRYCIRLDFPHEGENSIHLNINEPGHKQSSGFPFAEKEYQEAIAICQDEAIFDKLFYHSDDLYWFRSSYSTTIKQIERSDEYLGKALKDFQHKRAHISLFDPDEDNLDSISHFSAAFAEIYTNYEGTCVYGITDSEDDDLFQYILFQDYIFNIIIRLKSNAITNSFLSKNSNIKSESFSKIKKSICKYIKEKFPNDETLISYASEDLSFCELISKCLDRLDQLNI